MTSSTNSDLCQLLGDLIAFESVEKRLDQKHALIDYSENLLKKNGFNTQKYESMDQPSLVASTLGTKSPKVLLQAHIDVVPADEEQFELREEDAKLYGRGVFDMKFAVACYLQLAKELSKNLKDYDFGIMLTSDEEVGGQNGVSAVLERGHRAKICVLPDSGDNWQIQTSCNGVWILKVSANGESAHGSRPWEGKNAISMLTDAIHQIRELFPQKGKRFNTLTISQFQGGTAFNQVPDKAWATLDMRFINENEYSHIRTKVKTLLKQPGLNSETLAHVVNCTLDEKHPLVASFIESTEKVLGKPIGKTHAFGSSDAHYFEAHKIPTVLIRPNGGGAHSDNEWIDREGVENYYKLIKEYIEKEAKIA